jgi:hypothetical protein
MVSDINDPIFSSGLQVAVRLLAIHAGQLLLPPRKIPGTISVMAEPTHRFTIWLEGLNQFKSPVTHNQRNLQPSGL